MIPVLDKLGQKVRAIDSDVYGPLIILIQVADMMDAKVAGDPQELEMMNWMTRYVVDSISEAGFGHSLQALDDLETKNNPFPDAVKRFG